MTISRWEDGTQGFRQVCGLSPTPQKKLNEKKVGELAHLLSSNPSTPKAQKGRSSIQVQAGGMV
jgi:hypothetical protein